MSPESVSAMFIHQAQRLEREGNQKLAERVYLVVDEPDLAITMYKKARQYDNMVRLVKSSRPELLKETYLHLAQQLEMEGNLKVRTVTAAAAVSLYACVSASVSVSVYV
jgi:intraflagellar transport protein 172